ncbi:MAG: hypothetical protein RMJ55_15525 [Roseiflexaceae bacterium]|nr:hypothetical protein [Roseiflexus sp.]MDW8214966.1 hypothetical protein [Roseiflexaceae bacterium]
MTDRILLQVLPVEEESEDLETTAAAVDLTDQARRALAAEGYAVRPVSDGMRGDLLEIVTRLAQAAVDHKAELAALITAAIATLGKLSEHRRIGKLEISRGNEKLVIENADRAVVERTVREFVDRLAPSGSAPIRVTQRISKRKR